MQQKLIGDGKLSNLRPELRDLGWIQRWSIVPMFRRQSTAEHSFFVAVYALELYEVAIGGPPGSAFMKWALLHDADEIHSGDIPTPYKRKIGIKTQPPDLDPLDIQIIRIADILEAYIFLLEEKMLGNYKALKLEEQLSTRLFNECANLTEDYGVRTKVRDHIVETLRKYVNYDGRVE